ncbi:MULTISPECIES: GFA family protein [unclassified Roseovarius]|uniref:GFA family protein n=1 Tax=unclassified Roseovarius TaxID=2614913 RepID=UPI00273FD9AC|nr:MULTISPECIES: GFA family protein [unclassified Roseovarius]
MAQGSCLCGAVTFTVETALKDPLACHCKQCRQQSGHYFAAAHAPKEAVNFSRQDGLTWFRASDIASRGFCRECGATLFWRADHGDEIAVALGAIDGPTGLSLGRHVWANAKGDYYDIADGVPQQEGFEG